MFLFVVMNNCVLPTKQLASSSVQGCYLAIVFRFGSDADETYALFFICLSERRLCLLCGIYKKDNLMIEFSFPFSQFFQKIFSIFRWIVFGGTMGASKLTA